MDPITSLIKELSKLGAQLRPPASQDMVRRTEARLGVKFPADFCRYLMIAEGTESATQKWIWDFHSLTKMKTVAGDRGPEYCKHHTWGGSIFSGRELVGFCDVLIDAPTYVICADPSHGSYGQVFADQPGGCWFVAPGFLEFAQLFVEKSEDVLLFPRNA